MKEKVKKVLAFTWSLLCGVWWLVFLLACLVYLPIILDYTDKAISSPTISARGIQVIKLLPLWVLSSVIGLGVYKIYRILKSV